MAVKLRPVVDKERVDAKVPPERPGPNRDPRNEGLKREDNGKDRLVTDQRCPGDSIAGTGLVVVLDPLIVMGVVADDYVV